MCLFDNAQLDLCIFVAFFVSALSKRRYSLLQPKNARILEALGISLDDRPKNIEKKLIEMMKKAFKNEEVISPITPLPGGGI